MEFEDYVIRNPCAKSLPTMLDTHEVERSVRFSCGWVQVRNYTWTHPVEDVWFLKSQAYLVDFALSPRTADSNIAYLDLKRSSQPPGMGRVIVIPPGCNIRAGATGGRQRSMHCVLDRGVVEDILQQAPEWDERLLLQAARADSRPFEWLLSKIYREMRQEGFASDLMIESLANGIAVELARCFQVGRSVDRPHRGGLAPWRMRIVRERAYADLPAPSLVELADLCGTTVRHLCRAFKTETGQTVGKFVEDAMVERARALLAESRMSIPEVARTMGFANASSFAFAFRRATGFTPRDVDGYRQRRRSHPGSI